MAEPIQAAYLAAEGFADVLAEELALKRVPIASWHGALALSPAPPVDACWALNTWLAPSLHPAPSIGEAAAILRGMQRNWAAYAVAQHRRTALITAKLPVLRPKPLLFPAAAPTAHIGAWTLLADGALLASPRQTSPFANGAAAFVEDRDGPPSRAYLKLWEALCRLGSWPAPGDICMDLGAAPGGWSWVLAQLGAQVIAVDKAALDPRVADRGNVAVRQESALQ